MLPDSDDLLKSSDNPDLGVIKVEVFKIVNKVPRRQPKMHSRSRFQPIGVVHERSKKAGTHCIGCVPPSGPDTLGQYTDTTNPFMLSLGEGRKIPPPRPSKWLILTNREPFATFLFRYRPLG